MVQTVLLDGSALNTAQVEAVARAGAKVKLAPEAVKHIARARSAVEARLNDGQAHYGINTGFGSLARTRVEAERLRDLQVNLVRSHSAGVGEPLPEAAVRAMLFVLAASLARGISGVRPALVERLIGLLNAGITPAVPEIGSVGASGDLAPLAHAAQVLMGEGEVLDDGRAVAAGPVLERAGLEPLQLEAKEGLAFINGTHLMAGRAALLCRDFDRLFDAAVAGAAMSLDACRGTDEPLDPRLFEARAQPGVAMVAQRMRHLLAGSQIIPSHKDDDPRVQDPYSIRCAPMVLGSAWDAAGYVKLAVERELAAVTDNPLVFGDDIVSGGNFHGMPVAIPLDLMTIAIAHIAGIAERRMFFLLSATEPESHLVPFLSPRPGLHSGLMIAQYTAAACCNEIVGLSTPASVANIPTSAGIEDYNSFGPRAAAKGARAMELCRHVVAIELICSAEGLEYHRPLRSGAGVEAAHDLVRQSVARYTADRAPSGDIARVASQIREGAFSAMFASR